eukprot:1160720-Pelagomonas_calceolata.AAC.8
MSGCAQGEAQRSSLSMHALQATSGSRSNEWEEKWGEKHAALGEVNKYADKWAKEGDDVWHERWGEDYDGKGACKKWTDKWAERLVAGARANVMLGAYSDVQHERRGED